MKKLILLASAFALMLCACDSNADQPDNTPNVDIELSGAERIVAESTQNFYGKMLNAAMEADATSKSVVVSPLSAAVYLSMLSNGVEDGLKNEILASLNCSDQAALNSLMGKLSTQIQDVDHKCSISLPNSVWYDSNLQLNNDFKATMEGVYKAPLFQRPFSGTETIKEINSWIKTETKGRITNMLNKFTDDQVFALVNVTYFNGKWSKPFEASKIAKGTFKGANGESQVDMLNGEVAATYFENEDFQAVALPYGDKKFVAVMVLPRENVQPNYSSALEKYYQHAFGNCDVTLSMPKFSALHFFDCNKTLNALGINIDAKQATPLTMFTTQAACKINVIQGVSVSFDENGAEAAAATTNGMLGSTLPAQATLTIDRPFGFFIVEKTTGTCLVAGHVRDI